MCPLDVIPRFAQRSRGTLSITGPLLTPWSKGVQVVVVIAPLRASAILGTDLNDCLGFRVVQGNKWTPAAKPSVGGRNQCKQGYVADRFGKMLIAFNVYAGNTLPGTKGAHIFFGARSPFMFDY